jgi:hypothetical protein
VKVDVVLVFLLCVHGRIGPVLQKTGDPDDIKALGNL